jgi:hypothetical protein
MTTKGFEIIGARRASELKIHTSDGGQDRNVWKKIFKELRIKVFAQIENPRLLQLLALNYT